MYQLEQLRRSFVVAKKDVWIYYAKGPVVVFGLIFPLFLLIAFTIGRNMTVKDLFPGLMGMAIFFTSTAVGPAILPLGGTLQDIGTAGILSGGGLGPSSGGCPGLIHLWIADLHHPLSSRRIDGRGSCAPPGLRPGHDFSNLLFCIAEHLAIGLPAYGCACHCDDAILAGEVSSRLH